MSNSNSSRVVRVSIPSTVQKTIEDIKEITGNHSEEEIYSMLKECSMDPNETAQKLLFQDTFHEVKRKRDRKRENVNKEEPKWKPAMQGRGNKGSRGLFTPRHASLDAGGRSSGPEKENGPSQFSDKSINPSSVPTVEAKNTSSSSKARANGPGLGFGSNSIVHNTHALAGREVKQSEATAGAGSVKLDGPRHAPSHDATKVPKASAGSGDMLGQKIPNSANSSTSYSSPPSSGAYFSVSDPVLLPSNDSRPPGAIGTIRREVGSQRVPFEHVPTNSNDSKTTAVSDSRSPTLQVKMSSKLQGPGKNQVPESLQSASSAQGVSTLCRPSSNYNNRPPVTGPQKAGPAKEWKPKPTNSNIAQGSTRSAAVSSDVCTVSSEVNTRLQSAAVDVEAVDVETREGTSELQQKLEKTHIWNIQHVIIPNHIQVPEAEKLGFRFGSFEASLGLSIGHNEAAKDEKTPSLCGTSEGVEEMVNEQISCDQNPSTTAENADCPDQFLPSRGEENLSAKPEDVPSSLTKYGESKQDTLQGGHQYSVHASPNYSFGFVPPTLGSQLAPSENSESQSRDVSRLSNFVVQQPIDPTSYYPQFYRSGTDGDGRVSPFHSAGVSTNYNGNVAVVPPQTSQSVQEGGNPLVLSTSAPTPLATQPTGLVQSSAAVTQQPVPVYRQATGMHLPHYPPNYIPFAHYFSPYYPPTAIHQFLSNGAFPQPPQAGVVYPPPPSAAARYSLSQYRPGNSTHITLPGSYGPYGSSTANYNPSSSTSGGNPASSEDLSATQYKENNVHVSGQQQSEGSGTGVWITPGRDISSLQASSFYNLPQGQLAFTPTQPSHGNHPGLYHPAQPVTGQAVHPLMQQSQTMAGPIDMVGPTATVYQHPQHSQVNWPTSY